MNRHYQPEAYQAHGISSPRDRRRALQLLAALSLLLLALWQLPVPVLIPPDIYIPAHTILEAAAVIIACLIFAVGWHARHGHSTPGMLILSALFLGVAMLDFSHMLSYEGMPVYVTKSDAEKGINFWLAARSYAVLALLTLALLPRSSDSRRINRTALLSVVLLATALIHWWFLFHPERVPATFDAETGLTGLKIAYEYVLAILYILAAALFYRKWQQHQKQETLALFMAAAIMALSEFYFTLYSDVTDIYNLLGHIYKILAYFFLYRALVITGIHRPYAEAQAARKRLEVTLAALPDLMFEVDGNTVIHRYHSSRNRGDLFVRPETFLGRPIGDFLPDAAAEQCRRAIKDIGQQGESTGRRYELMLEDGRHWFEITGAPLELSTEAQPRFILLVRDITERLRQEAEVRIAATAFESQEPIIITDEQLRVVRVNAAFEQVTGFSGAEVEGTRITALLRCEDTRNPNFIQALEASPKQYNGWHGELLLHCKDGSERPFRMILSAVRNEDDQVTHYIFDAVDLSNIKKARERIDALSWYDSLTGLPNRDHMMRELENTARDCQRQGLTATLIMLDINQLKTLNDTVGHEAGDHLLQEVSTRLQASASAGEYIARFGGDQFVVISDFPCEEPEEAAARAQNLASLLLTAVTGEYRIDERTHFSGASVGVTLISRNNATPAEILRQADLALSQSKQDASGSIRFFDPDWQALVSQRALWLQDLRQALASKQFILHFQPQLTIRNQVTGAEALIRWQHPQHGLVPPDQFIGLAEDHGLMPAIGRWVLKESLARLQQWQSEPATRHLGLSVNVSPKQLYSGQFAHDVWQLIREVGCDATGLTLELTEHTLLDNIEQARSIIEELNYLGVQFAIDDFGTGYSSLAYLSRLPMDQLKIDRSFVSRIGQDERDTNITQAIIEMAHSLGMGVLAEGVETQEQLDYLERHGCQHYQGYLFSPPLPLDDFMRLIEEQSR